MNFWFQAKSGEIQGPFEGENPAHAFVSMCRERGVDDATVADGQVVFGSEQSRAKCGALRDWDILDYDPGEDDERDLDLENDQIEDPDPDGEDL